MDGSFISNLLVQLKPQMDIVMMFCAVILAVLCGIIISTIFRTHKHHHGLNRHITGKSYV